MTSSSSSFHCCASCIHFEIRKTSKKESSMDIDKVNHIENHIENHIDNQIDNHQGKITYHCSRLGFVTKPTHQFNCWTPKEQVVRLMNKKNL